MGRVLEFKDVYQSNVRGSEGAGTTTLISSDARRQIFNLSAARTVALPSTGVLKGDVYTFENVATGNFALTVQSSGLNTIGVVNSLYARLNCIALQDSPTTAAHWKVTLDQTLFQYKHGTNYNGGTSPQITLSAGGGSLSAVDDSFFVPYQDVMGNWFMRGGARVSLSSTSRGSATLAIFGFLFGNTYGVSTFFNASATFTNGSTINGTNTITIYHATLTTTLYAFQFDVPITGRPTFAY